MSIFEFSTLRKEAVMDRALFLHVFENHFYFDMCISIWGKESDHLIHFLLCLRFICEPCREARGIGKRKENRFNARKLPQSKLGEHIENRVNNFLKEQENSEGVGYVTIRIVSSVDKVLETRSGMKARYVIVLPNCNTIQWLK